MTQDDTYRARAQTVRLAARAQLLEMRRTRLAKRSGADPVADVPDDAVDEPLDELATAVIEDGEGDLADAPPAAVEEAEAHSADALGETADQPAAMAEEAAESVAVALVPKPKRKAAATKPVSRKPDTRKSEPKRAAKPDDTPDPAPAVFLHRPRIRPDVLSRPVMVAPPPVFDADDLSVLAAAMSEIEDDQPQPMVAAPVTVRPAAALVAAPKPAPMPAPATAAAPALTGAGRAVTVMPPEPEPEHAPTATDLAPETDGDALPEVRAASVPTDAPALADCGADLTEALADPEPDPEPDPVADPVAEALLMPSMEQAASPDVEDCFADPDADVESATETASTGLLDSAPDEAHRVETPAEPAAAHGLYALPGAGPGLIWMLGQVGIDSMDDLARADADDLGRKLGLVGQILNVGSWVEFARSADGRSASYR